MRPVIKHLGSYKQAVRTGLAAAASYVLTGLIGLEYGYWAVISTIIVMQGSLGGSLRAGGRRILGTAIGATMGTVFLVLFEPSWWILGILVVLTLAVAELVTRAQETFRMAGVTATIVMLAWRGTGSELWFGIERFFEIIIGVGVAVLFSVVLWPIRAARNLRVELADELRALADWQVHSLHQFLGRGVDQGYDRVDVLARRIQSNRELHDQARRELSLLGTESGNRLLPALGSLERVFGLVRGLSRIAAVSPADGYQQLLAREIGDLGDECSQTMRILADRIQPGFQGRENIPSRLPVVVESLEDKLLELRRTDATKKYPLMDVANVFAYVQTLKSLAVELEWLALKW